MTTTPEEHDSRWLRMAYDLQNLPFDPAVEAMKAAEAAESATKPLVATLLPQELKDSHPVFKPEEST
jgi:hypothetical protein